MWGEGFQVDSSQEYSNFTPKKIKAFVGPDRPDIVDMAFGWYHEAYIDKQGKLYVCAKAKMSSIKIREVPDGIREPLTQVTTLPRGAKVRQVSFTRTRMFVLSEDGRLFVFPIEETAAPREELMFSRARPEFTGELMVDNPIHVKEVPKLKQLASGTDHVIALDRTGQVWAMGDDTFGQCGQSAENRSSVAPFYE